MPHSKSATSSRKTILSRAGLFILAAAIGYAGSIALFPSAPPSSAAPRPATESKSPLSADGERAAATNPTPLPEELYSSSAVLSTLQTLAPESLAAAQQSLQKDYLALMVRDLSERDPSAAARLLDSHPTPPSAGLVQTLARQWSESDPRAALAWYTKKQSFLSDDDYGSGLQEILLTSARQDPGFAYSQLQTLVRRPEQRDELLGPIAAAMAETENGQALNWLASLDPAKFSPPAFQKAQLIVLQAQLRNDPYAAIAAIHSESLRSQLAPQTAAALADVDLAGAVDWIDDLTDPKTKQDSLAAIATESLSRDPQTALDILLSFPELFDASSESLNAALGNLAQKQPQLLIQHFDEIPQSAKAETAAEITEAAFANAQPSPEYLDWFDALPNGATRDAAARIAIRHFATDKPVAAVQWARNLSDKRERLETFGSLIEDISIDELPELAGSIAALDLSEEENSLLEKALEDRLSQSLPHLPLPR